MTLLSIFLIFHRFSGVTNKKISRKSNLRENKASAQQNLQESKKNIQDSPKDQKNFTEEEKKPKKEEKKEFREKNLGGNGEGQKGEMGRNQRDKGDKGQNKGKISGIKGNIERENKKSSLTFMLKNKIPEKVDSQEANEKGGNCEIYL